MEVFKLVSAGQVCCNILVMIGIRDVFDVVLWNWHAECNGRKYQSINTMNTTLVLLGQLLSMSFGASVEADYLVRIPVEPLHIAVRPLESSSDLWVEHEKSVRTLVTQQISDVLNDKSYPLMGSGDQNEIHFAGQESGQSICKEMTESASSASTGVVASTELPSSEQMHRAERG